MEEFQEEGCQLVEALSREGTKALIVTAELAST